jgi:hypothetical protein
MIATGIIGIISQKEQTQVSVSIVSNGFNFLINFIYFKLYIFNALCWVTAVFSLYQTLSSILHIEPYLQSSTLSNNENRVCCFIIVLDENLFVFNFSRRSRILRFL